MAQSRPARRQAAGHRNCCSWPPRLPRTGAAHSVAPPASVNASPSVPAMQRVGAVIPSAVRGHMDHPPTLVSPPFPRRQPSRPSSLSIMERPSPPPRLPCPSSQRRLPPASNTPRPTATVPAHPPPRVRHNRLGQSSSTMMKHRPAAAVPVRPPPRVHHTRLGQFSSTIMKHPPLPPPTPCNPIILRTRLPLLRHTPSAIAPHPGHLRP